MRAVLRAAQTFDFMRHFPRQQRGREKVNFILEAAAQLLEKGGERGFNTNAIAERAGVSIGALYRYFPDKGAILQALAEREIAAHHAHWVELVENRPEGLALDRAMIRAFLQAFGQRTRARQIAMQAWFARASAETLADRYAKAPNVYGDAAAQLPRIRAFVHSRAMMGAMRAAVLEGVDFLQHQDFEDELVRLSRAILR